MLTMLSAFAQLDRAFILARTKEGRERAKANGRRFGRGPKLNEQQIVHAQDLRREGRGMREIGALLGCNASTISRALQVQQEEKDIA
ncbi:DNA invertase Pin-like site-specific DNA recombinase [Bradyrhizobium japonicum]|jgi:DNA invertase Pin-like site-specific DNA recombinase